MKTFKKSLLTILFATLFTANVFSMQEEDRGQQPPKRKDETHETTAVVKKQKEDLNLFKLLPNELIERILNYHLFNSDAISKLNVNSRINDLLLLSAQQVGKVDKRFFRLTLKVVKGILDNLQKRGFHNPLEFPCFHYFIFNPYINKENIFKEFAKQHINRNNVDFGYPNNVTPFFFACLFKNIDAIKTLLKKGARVFHTIPAGGTAFSLALDERYNFSQDKAYKICKLILKKCNPNKIQNICGHCNPFKNSLFRDFNDFINMTNNNNHNYTVLHTAAANNYIKIIDLFLKYGANIEVKCSNDATPLHIAIEKENPEIVSTLLKHGANIEAKDYYSQTPLHLAAGYGFDNIVFILLKNGVKIETKKNNKFTALHMAATEGHANVVKNLLIHGAKINGSENELKLTPLHCAVYNGHNKVIETLLKNKANIEALTSTNCTPLTLAIEKNSIETIKLLLEKGASIRQEDIDIAPTEEIRQLLDSYLKR